MPARKLVLLGALVAFTSAGPLALWSPGAIAASAGAVPAVISPPPVPPPSAHPPALSAATSPPGREVTTEGGQPCAYGAPNGGYLATTSNGQVFSFGTATAHGTLAATGLSRPIVGIAATPGGSGYWLVAGDGGVFSFGDARFHGSTGGIRLSQPIVGVAATPDAGGYWLVAADGGVFSFGDARFRGSTGGMHLSKPIVGMAATPDGKGYWLVASDGGIFAFGDARFHGSTGGERLADPIVGMAATPDGSGYWLDAADGGIFAFGNARFRGSATGRDLAGPVVGMAVTPDGDGYTLLGADGSTFPFGTATFQGTLAGGLLGSPVVAVVAIAGQVAKGQPIEFTGYPVLDEFGGYYYYAGANQYAVASGASVQICQADPDIGNVSSPDSVGHSLTEMAVGNGAGSDYIEFISITQQFDSGPTLWMTWWDNGNFQGSDGFVQLSPTILNGMNLPVGSTASYAVLQSDSRWDFYYDGQLVGYFPDSLWNDTFTVAGEVQVFGEVQANNSAPPQGQMGNGVFGDQAGSATVNGYQLFGSRPPAGFGQEYATETTPDYYDTSGLTPTSFRYGGPGAT
jgi:hypothetical protein